MLFNSYDFIRFLRAPTSVWRTLGRIIAFERGNPLKWLKRKCLKRGERSEVKMKPKIKFEERNLMKISTSQCYRLPNNNGEICPRHIHLTPSADTRRWERGFFCWHKIHTLMFAQDNGEDDLWKFSNRNYRGERCSALVKKKSVDRISKCLVHIAVVTTKKRERKSHKIQIILLWYWHLMALSTRFTANFILPHPLPHTKPLSEECHQSSLVCSLPAHSIFDDSNAAV